MSSNENVETQSIAVPNEAHFEAHFEAHEIETSNVPEIVDHEPAPEMATEHGIPTADDRVNEGELPEFAKRRLGREQKKHERTLSEYERRVAELEAKLQAQQSFQSGTIFNDPLTGEAVDVATPEGQERYKYLQKVTDNLNKQDAEKSAAEARRIEKELYDHVYDSFEDAKERHPDFLQVMQASGFDKGLVKELATFRDPGALGYYIGANPREVARLKTLPAYQVKRELERHLTDMILKQKITNAPAPVKSPKDGVSGKPSNNRIKSVQELMAEKREKIRRGR